jgi:PTH1 family peptidyl-tRNA hydrolase
MKMIVGLGNPGKGYERNRHNVGFQCVDLLAARHGLRFDIRKGKAKAALGTLQLPGQPPSSESSPGAGLAVRVLLAKPQAFMNVSGQSVAALAAFYKVEPADILVIYDDLDLPLGSVRARPSGGSGGHNGMKSTIQALGTQDFPRLRVGIDRPPGRMDPAAYVLQDFSPHQEQVMDQVREVVVAACEHWLSHGITATMNDFNASDVTELPRER